MSRHEMPPLRAPRKPARNMMKTTSSGAINLWSWWGDPVIAGDYVRRIDDYSVVDVPAPGMLGLFGLALVALGFGRRRRMKAKAAA